MLWKLTKPFLFRMDPERAHHFTMRCLKFMPPWFAPLRYSSQKLCGIEFANPVGLAAGMDKNGERLLAWQSLGFGFVEVGTVTALPQDGNPKPRLFRLTEQAALFNRMGFNNDGAQAIAARIEKQKRNNAFVIPIGINIGKSAAVSLEDAPLDYVASFEKIADLADYITINVSSPNTVGLRSLQQRDALSRIIEAIAQKNATRQFPRPIFIKLAPDLDDEEVIDIGKTALKSGAIGLIISNTSIQPLGIHSLPGGGGGLSGAPLFAPSTRMLRLLRQALGEKVILIGSGGIMNPKDAVDKMNHGADLIQVYSGLVYAGPKFVRDCVAAIRVPTISSMR